MFKRLIVTAAVLATGLGAASAADMRMPVKAPPPVVDPPFSWAGFYLGGNIGYSWGRAQTDLSETQTNTAVLTNLIGGIGGTAGPGNGTTTSTTTTVSGSSRANIDGVVGGAQIGGNWQFD